MQPRKKRNSHSFPHIRFSIISRRRVPKSVTLSNSKTCNRGKQHNQYEAFETVCTEEPTLISSVVSTTQANKNFEQKKRCTSVTRASECPSTPRTPPPLPHPLERADTVRIKNTKPLHLPKPPSPSPSPSPHVLECLEDRNTETKKCTCDAWKTLYKFYKKHFGLVHLKTANSLLDLGDSYMRSGSYEQALQSFKNAVRIRRTILGNEDLSVAHALDCVGNAAAKMNELDWAMIAFHEAFEIRYRTLGSMHIDVGNTLNNIAGVHLLKNDLVEAEKAYKEVLLVRRAVFGSHHPSVAVTLRTLAGIHVRLTKLDDALSEYDEAFRIYTNDLKLRDNHPMTVRLSRELESTERLMVTMGYR